MESKKSFKPFKKWSRAFLEPGNSEVDSYINWFVEVGEKYTDSQVKISDCNRAITLYMDVDDTGLAKIDQLLGHLQEYRSMLVQGIKKEGSKGG